MAEDSEWAQFRIDSAPADEWSQFRVPEERHGEAQGPADERPFLERATSKLGSFFRNVYENPPPTVAGISRTIREAPSAAQELTWGADPEAAREAAGTMLGAATLALPAPRGVPLGRPSVVAAPAAAETSAAAANAAMGRLGIEAPYYITTPGETAARLAQGLKETPWSGEPITQSAQKLLADIQVARGGAGTAETGGAAAKQALESWITTGSKVPVKKAYQEVDRLVDPEKMQWLMNTGEEVKNIIAERANARIPGTSRAADQVLEALRSPMDYEGLQRLRSYVGEQTPEQLVASGINPRENKRIYTALTKDLRDVVSFAGGDQALAKWEEANALARLTAMQRNLLTKVIGTKGEVGPEQVFSRLMSFAGSKSTADVRRLALARSTMGPQAWNEVTGALINRMGADAAGQFSADRFVTAFNNLSPAARNSMFEPNQLATLNDVAVISKHIQDHITRLSNPSGTARTVYTLATLHHFYISPVTAVAQAVGARLAAQALARPVIAKAAADVGRASLAGDRPATAAALRRLQTLAARAGLLSAADTARQTLGPAPQQQMPQ